MYTSGHTSYIDAHIWALWHNSKRHETQEGTHTSVHPRQQSHQHTHFEFFKQVHTSVFCVVLFCQTLLRFFGSSHNRCSPRSHWSVCLLKPKKKKKKEMAFSRLPWKWVEVCVCVCVCLWAWIHVADKTCLPVGRFNIVPNQPSSLHGCVKPRKIHFF